MSNDLPSYWSASVTVEYPSPCFNCGEEIYKRIVVRGFSQGAQYECKKCNVSWWDVAIPERYKPLIQKSKENLT